MHKLVLALFAVAFGSPAAVRISVQSEQLRHPIQTNAAPATNQQSILFNHFYLVLDSETYRAIVNDRFLRERFSANEVRTTVRTDKTYTGLYFYGAHTYFELFDVANSAYPSVGDSGIAFGTEAPNVVASLAASSAGSIVAGKEPITRLFSGQPVPWFYQAAPSDLPDDGPISSWIMEYHPDFLLRWHPTGEPSSITRSSILDRYREVLPKVSDPVFRDVKQITLAANPATTERLVHWALMVGLKKKGHLGRVTLIGNGFSIVLIPSTEQYHGIRTVRMRISSGHTELHDLILGHCKVHFSGREVEWIFAGAGKADSLERDKGK